MIESLKAEAKRLSSLTRKIERFVHNPIFELFYNDCTQEKKQRLHEAIKKLDLQTLKSLIMDEKDIAELGIRRLRLIGRDLNVYNWYSLPKCVLIVEIERARNEKRSDGQRNTLDTQVSLVRELEDTSGES